MERLDFTILKQRLETCHAMLICALKIIQGHTSLALLRKDWIQAAEEDDEALMYTLASCIHAATKTLNSYKSEYEKLEQKLRLTRTRTEERVQGIESSKPTMVN
ncbi:hypothetical protein [Phaeocystidibacter marisrubri]|uniref:Uncharacterized protein n=1 Tax=Phaeocystidibacter marisrubri TaxID=1577780 RepID=A0A6L3ZG72_9FLAO|nr:hypothetical protein [Phaeocystidibacter marisrubri]KAB2816817.1 hypothetical protein F8C82_00005 [Phaeocystidibacter marisrubri]GGH78025.1 hypothetical protein GCM10011318_28680 [Phaeocystidibacter marisrubri]